MPHAWGRPATAWAVLAAALRLAWPMGLDLYGDEAYYFLWSRRLAFGYFDHPPLVAWLARLGTALGSHSELALRLPFAVCGGLAVFCAAGLAAELSADARAPTLAAALAAVAPLPFLSSALALPDGPLCAAAAGALWAGLRAARTGATLDWLAAGVAAGLALLAKQAALALVPGLLAAVALDPALRGQLRRPAPWLGLAFAAAVASPYLAWEAGHDWASLRFQLAHASGETWTGRGFATFLGAELITAGPLTALGVFGLAQARSPAERRLAWLVAPPLIGFGWTAARGRFEANWPAFVDPALCASAASLLLARWSAQSRAIGAAACALSAAGLALAGLELRHPWILSPDSVEVLRFRQGRSLAAAVTPELSPGTFLFTWSYQDAGELAFYSGQTRLGSTFERPSQLDLWGDLPRAGEPFALLGPPGSAERFYDRLSCPQPPSEPPRLLFLDPTGQTQRELVRCPAFERLTPR